MRKPKKSAPYEEHKAYWYAKLKSSGFEDIEDDKGVIKGDTTLRRAMGRAPEDAQARLAYYTKAEHYLVERTKAWSPLEARVWALHAGGMSYREAAAVSGCPVHVSRHIVETIRGEMLSHVVGEKEGPDGDSE